MAHQAVRSETKSNVYNSRKLQSTAFLSIFSEYICMLGLLVFNQSNVIILQRATLD
jgi:hypothetical protein